MELSARTGECKICFKVVTARQHALECDNVFFELVKLMVQLKKLVKLLVSNVLVNFCPSLVKSFTSDHQLCLISILCILVDIYSLITSNTASFCVFRRTSPSFGVFGVFAQTGRVFAKNK